MTGATSSAISPGRGTIKLDLLLKDGSRRATLRLHDVWYIFCCLANLVSQARLNDTGVHYNNISWTLFLKGNGKQIGYVPRVRNNFIFNLSINSTKGFCLGRTANLVEMPEHTIFHTSKPSSLYTWHVRLGHFNIPGLRVFLKSLEISYSDDITEGFYCDACELAKATKIYNRVPQERATQPFHYIHTDMVGPIKPKGFLDEIYFFTFTCDATRFTHVYTAKTKSEWLSHLQTYFSLTQNKTGKPKPIARLRTDFGTKLRSDKVDAWMLKEGITFEPSAPYSQEQN